MRFQVIPSQGAENNDCLLGTIARLKPENQNEQDEKALATKGWQMIFEGIDDMDTEDLLVFFGELKRAYPAIDLDENQSVDVDQAEDNQEKVRQQIKQFLEVLQAKSELTKTRELLMALSKAQRQALNVEFISKDILKSPRDYAQLYLNFSRQLKEGRVPQYIAHNGNHFCNVRPENGALNQNQAPDNQEIKQIFLQLMSECISEAAGFEHPKYLERSHIDEENQQVQGLVPYDEAMLEEDLEQLIDHKLQTIGESNKMSSDNWANVDDILEACNAISPVKQQAKLLELNRIVDKKLTITQDPIQKDVAQAVNAKSVDKSSAKGFVAIDLDGTALVEKLDKHFRYGWDTPNANLRQSLIQYLHIAKEQGYDVVILTARPSIVEPILKKLQLGSMPTVHIQEAFAAHNIDISQVRRKAFGGKGAKMQQILSTYPSGAKGFLIDDQTRQTDSVNRIGDERLRGFDINSPREMSDFLQWIGRDERNFQPEKIVNGVIRDIKAYVNENRSIEQWPNYWPETAELKNAADVLYAFITTAEQQNLNARTSLAGSIINELVFRLFEVGHRQYLPEIQWITTCADQINQLLKNTTHVRAASKAIFGKSNINQVVANTECEKTVKELLLLSLQQEPSMPVMAQQEESDQHCEVGPIKLAQ